MAFSDGARLLADIGSTFARFAVERERGRFERLETLRCADYPDFGSALKAYLAMVQDMDVRHGAVAISNPVEGDLVRMTNYHWQFSIEQTRLDCGLDTLLVVNDFTALAVGVPHLREDQRRQIGGGQARARSVIGLLGAGTGLGVSGLIPADDGWISLGSEGGHVSFSPTDEREAAILEFAWTQYSHVSAERLLSGSGLELIYKALCHLAGKPAETLSALDITSRGLSKQCALCEQTLEVFCGMLGAVAANLAVTLGAFGGIYIGGAIVPRLGEYFDQSAFRRRFESKGRFSGFVASIPTYVITADQATFIGVAAILDAQLRKRSGGASILDRIRQLHRELSPAERRVADVVLSRPRSILNDPIMEIARAADVSQPTVIRFCRTLGCEGLSDFKLRLASSLTGTIPVTHTQVTVEDTALELGAKVLGNTASAILQIRDQLNRKAIDQAIELLLKAKRIDFYAVGNYGIVAEDAQYKFLRFGLPTAAHTEPRLQLMAANVLTPEDVLVVISSTGRIPELNAAVDAALERGAQVVAITANQSPLSKKATITIALDHSEDVATQVPMISRVLYLLVIDILAVGVAMRAGLTDELGAGELAAAVNALETGGEHRLARMVSHSQR
ncbi:MAG TPA: glucokinase [Burkholderiaceae bacterium]|nr:glucokinase [Burkholderiaceae bacterium]